MSYNPFNRGPYGVGVRTLELQDAERSRSLPLELWYPAERGLAGRDLEDPTRDRYRFLPGLPLVPQDAVRDAEPADGRFPLVAFSHGFGGHRRQSTFFCTHLASHGYVVASPDHTGNTVADTMRLMMQAHAGSSLPEPQSLVQEFISARPADITFLLDRLLDGSVCGLADRIDGSRVGMTGHSFGGWTTLVAAARDPRIQAALPLAPAGGRSAFAPDPLRGTPDLTSGRSVPILYLVAERDTLLPLDGMHELLARTPEPRRLAVLMNADHMHFCDRVEETHELFRLLPAAGLLAEIAKQIRPVSELCPSAHAYDFVRGLGLAHMDWTLRQHPEAEKLLAGDLTALLAERGIEIEVA
jgi:predicted dienelactone hydrolase